MAEQIYVARVTANALAAGRFVALVTGEPVELSPAEADELLKVAFVVKATKGNRADVDDEANESERGEVATASLEPERTATTAAQNARSRKGNGA